MVKNENCFVCKTFEPSLVASDKADKEVELVGIKLTSESYGAVVSKLPFLAGVTSVPLFMAFENRTKLPKETQTASWTALKGLFQ